MPTMHKMAAGQLRHRVKVQDKSNARDASGGIVEEWRTLVTRWADIEPLKGRELFSAQEVDGRITHRVTMRHYPGLQATQRLLYGARVFNILTPPIDVDERHILSQMLCMEDA